MLVEEDPGRSAPRFFYDRRVLEIVSPGEAPEHEAVADIIASLVTELAVELEIDVASARSTTFKREDLSRGFEPDARMEVEDVPSPAELKRQFSEAREASPDRA